MTFSTAKNVVEDKISEMTGLSISEIKMYSPERLRAHLERRAEKKFSFVSEFPSIGRGNVLRDNIASTERINKEIDKILGVRCG